MLVVADILIGTRKMLCYIDSANGQSAAMVTAPPGRCYLMPWLMLVLVNNTARDSE